MENTLKVVVAGEIDAGKSTLIGRLLYDTGSLPKTAMLEVSQASRLKGNILEFAYLLDGLAEEREGQLTIDTTQVFCQAAKSGFLFIDVPGHAELLKNMLCGSSYAQAAVLIVDVTKPVADGTIRHAGVLKFLGIEQIVVVLNKLDAVGFSQDVFEQKKREIFKFADSLGMKIKYFIPVSSRQGDNLTKKSANIPWYKGPCLIAALNFVSQLEGRERKRGFYFPIQDVYTIKNKSVFVGTILSGKIRKNDSVYVSPEAKTNKIKGIMVFGKNKLSAGAPESIGLELVKPDGLARGQIIYKDDLLQPSHEITAKILCVQPINSQDKLFFNCATQQTLCSIKNINSFYSVSLGTTNRKVGLNKADIAEVVIVMKEAVVVKKFFELEALGRFVLKKGREICAAGVIIK